jgi:hypothetical protein
MDIENEKTEEEIAELVADALTAIGFSASSQDTGGGICCVVLERKGGGEIVWGTADFNWGASVVNADGEIESSLETKCPSDSQDIAAIVEAIRGASVAAGETTTGAV